MSRFRLVAPPVTSSFSRWPSTITSTVSEPPRVAPEGMPRISIRCRPRLSVETSTPGMTRSSSSSVRTPRSRISSARTSDTAAGAWSIDWGPRDATETTTSCGFSRLSRSSSSKSWKKPIATSSFPVTCRTASPLSFLSAARVGGTASTEASPTQSTALDSGTGPGGGIRRRARRSRPTGRTPGRAGSSWTGGGKSDHFSLILWPLQVGVAAGCAAGLHFGRERSRMAWTRGRWVEHLRGRRAGRLRLLVLAVSDRCDQRCVHCQIWMGHGGERPALTLAERLAVVDDALAAGAREALLTGGEPLLAADLWPIAARLRAAGARVMLATNGMLLAFHAAAVAASFDELYVSLDGGSPTTHDGLRGVPAFERLAAGLRALRALPGRPRLVARSTLHGGNAHEVEAIVAAAREMGFDQVSFLPLDASSDAFGGDPAARRPLVPSAATLDALEAGFRRLDDAGVDRKSVVEGKAVNPAGRRM